MSASLRYTCNVSWDAEEESSDLQVPMNYALLMAVLHRRHDLETGRTQL